MIEKIDHKNAVVAGKIRAVFQVSYAVEAKLLGAIDFPPLKRGSVDFLHSDTEFYGFIDKKEVVGIIEIKRENSNIHIQSLVVDPKYFRQGIAGKLISFVFDSFNSIMYTVETGVENLPAITLYKKFGFIEVKQWDTDHGVRKVKLLKTYN